MQPILELIGQLLGSKALIGVAGLFMMGLPLLKAENRTKLVALVKRLNPFASKSLAVSDSTLQTLQATLPALSGSDDTEPALTSVLAAIKSLRNRKAVLPVNPPGDAV